MRSLLRALVCALALTVVGLGVSSAFAPTADAQQQYNPSVRPPPGASPPPVNPALEGHGFSTPDYDADVWRQVRQSTRGTVSIPDQNAGYLIDTSGETFRLIRKNEYLLWSAYTLGGMVALLAIFFLVRGRIKVSHGFAGSTITRFTDIERMAHWLLAVSFIILAITGLNLMFGRYILIPTVGKEMFALVTEYGKYVHNFVAFPFMLAVVLTFLLWVRHNLPAKEDLNWVLKGGGILTSAHPPARKFNAGQKILFWLVVLAGVSLSLSGLALLFPFQLPMFAKTFEVLNVVFVPLGFPLPTDLTPNMEQQFATLWHGILAVVMTAVVIAHIYIGTVGMQGAFAAMGSGEVDVNWAKEHHSIWADEVLEAERREVLGGRAEPAE